MEYNSYTLSINSSVVIWDELIQKFQFYESSGKNILKKKYDILRIFANKYNINYIWPVSTTHIITKIKSFLEFESATTSSIIVYSHLLTSNLKTIFNKTDTIFVISNYHINMLDGILLYKFNNRLNTKKCVYLMPNQLGCLDQCLKLMNKLIQLYPKINFEQFDIKSNAKYDLVLVTSEEPNIKCFESETSKSSLFYRLIIGLKSLTVGGTLCLYFYIDHDKDKIIKEIIYFLLKYFSEVTYTINNISLILVSFTFINFKPIDQFDQLDKICMHIEETLFDRYHCKTPHNYKNETVTFFDFDYTQEYLQYYKIIKNQILNVVNQINTDYDIISDITSKNQIDIISNYEKIIKLGEIEHEKNTAVVLNRCIRIMHELMLPVNQSYLDIDSKLNKKMVTYVKNIPKQYLFTFVYDKEKSKQIDASINNNFFVHNKDRLSLNKSYIDMIDINKWNKIRLVTNIPLYIKIYIRKEYSIPKASRAFIKIYELYSTFKNIIKGDTLNSLHMCEAPGEFIAATNHYAKLHSVKHFNWYANSLNYKSLEAVARYGKDIFADTYGFMRKYPTQWLYGVDDTGDITNPDNIFDIIKKAKTKLGTIMLFTSDAGQDVSDDFNEQENKVALLHFSQAFAALSALDLGGNAILKMYVPFSVKCNRDMIYLLYISFEKIHIVKQIAGSPGSSEIYVVCENYKNKISDKMSQIILSYMKKFTLDISLFDTYDENFINMLTIASNKLCEKQIAIIQRNFYYYNNENVFRDHYQLFDEAKINLAKYWCKFVDMQNISPKEHL